jgi:hypothetical protein
VVKRYEIDLSDGPRGGVIGRMVEDADGRWVKYSDYKNMRDENDRLTVAFVRADSSKSRGTDAA